MTLFDCFAVLVFLLLVLVTVRAWRIPARVVIRWIANG